MRADAAPSFILVPDLPGPGARITLADDESHYLTRVCRLRVGDRVSGTDGRGALAELRVIGTAPRAVVEVEARRGSEPTRSAWVLAGAPEGERGDWMVEKLAELGVLTLQPIDCERGKWEGSARRLDRWGRVAVAALRQSRRTRRMEIRPAVPLVEALETLPSGGERFVADPAGLLAASVPPPAEGVSVGVIGPASGLADFERDLIRSRDFRPISLSDARLRAETAAIAWAAWWTAGGEPAPGPRA